MVGVTLVVQCFAAMIGLLIASIVYKLATGGINCRGLLSNSPGGTIEPERVQALLVSLGAIAVYGFDALHAIGSGQNYLPDVPDTLLPILVASQALFLAGKIARSGA